MTREEAIETLKTENCYECSYGCGETINCPAEDCPLPEAVKMAIQALEQKPIDKSAMMYEIYMEGVNMCGEYQGCWVRFKDIEKIVDKYMGDKEESEGEE